MSEIFLASYLDTVRNATFLPFEKEELEIMLNAYLLEKAVYELGYELNNRPEWVITPLRGIRDLMESG
jgi:maltose alpha-D-glucosyltransferase/alpha-amylase